MYIRVFLVAALCVTGAQADWGSTIKTGKIRLVNAFNHQDYEAVKKLFSRVSHFTVTKDHLNSYGNKAAANWFKAKWRGGVASIAMTTTTIRSIGDVASERGTYTLRNADNSVVFKGIYMTTWHLEKGKLQITKALWW